MILLLVECVFQASNNKNVCVLPRLHMLRMGFMVSRRNICVPLEVTSHLISKLDRVLYSWKSVLENRDLQCDLIVTSLWVLPFPASNHLDLNHQTKLSIKII